MSEISAGGLRLEFPLFFLMSRFSERGVAIFVGGCCEIPRGVSKFGTGGGLFLHGVGSNLV